MNSLGNHCFVVTMFPFVWPLKSPVLDSVCMDNKSKTANFFETLSERKDTEINVASSPDFIPLTSPLDQMVLSYISIIGVPQLT